MKAIFTGTFANGFGISTVVEDDAAEDIVIAHLADGRLAEAVNIVSPASVDKRAVPAEDGKAFIVYGSVGDGVEVVGPFATVEDANDFAEITNDKADWSVFVAHG